MPCCTTLSSSTGSMLPPETTATTGGGNAAGSASTAATAAAPAGSTTSLARSRQKSRPRERSSSLTVRTSSTRSRTWANVCSPGAPPAPHPPPAGAHDDRGHVGALVDQLQPDRALAGDDVRVVERVDEHRP